MGGVERTTTPWKRVSFEAITIGQHANPIKQQAPAAPEGMI